MVRHLEEMAETSAWMVGLAMRAFRDRDAGGCRRQAWFVVTGELIEFGGAARTPRPASAPATSA